MNKLATSGSTGQPLVFMQDSDFRDSVTADIQRNISWAGWKLGDLQAFIWGGRMKPPLRKKLRARMIDWVWNRVMLNAFLMNEKDMITFAKLLRRQRPRILFGYVSSVNQFAQFIRLLGFLGYFVLGAFLPKIKVKTKYLLIFIIAGIITISVGTYYMAWFGNPKLYFFQEYLSPFVIVTSMMLFVVLFRTTPGRLEKKIKLSVLVNTISDYTLPIFLLHPIIMESLQNGYFGFAINGNVINQVIEVPILTFATLAICLAIIIPVSKIPIVKKLVGIN